MNCCFETIIDCCEELTKTKNEFIYAMQKISGITTCGLMKNKRCKRIIDSRSKREQR